MRNVLRMEIMDEVLRGVVGEIVDGDMVAEAVDLALEQLRSGHRGRGAADIAKNVPSPPQLSGVPRESGRSHARHSAGPTLQGGSRDRQEGGAQWDRGAPGLAGA